MFQTSSDEAEEPSRPEMRTVSARSRWWFFKTDAYSGAIMLFHLLVTGCRTRRRYRRRNAFRLSLKSGRKMHGGLRRHCLVVASRENTRTFRCRSVVRHISNNARFNSASHMCLERFAHIDLVAGDFYNAIGLLFALNFSRGLKCLNHGYTRLRRGLWKPSSRRFA